MNHFAHSLCLSAKLPMPKKSAYVVGGFIEINVKVNKTVPGMEKTQIIKSVISGEERRAAESVQKWDDLIPVLHSEAAYVNSDLLEMYLSSQQALALNGIYVFVDYFHNSKQTKSLRLVN